MPLRYNRFNTGTGICVPPAVKEVVREDEWREDRNILTQSNLFKKQFDSK